MTYFVTGATGFIGRHLVERLLAREGNVYVLVRGGEESAARLDERIERWGQPERIVAVTGDLTEPRLGVPDEQLAQLRGEIDHFFHLAALYDLTASEERNVALNVQGTHHAVELANALEAGIFHHVSSIAVGGRYEGHFREDMFDEGQKLDHPYFRTKFDSEKIARSQVKGAWRVYRPAVVVGNSKTGEMDKIDGPYYFFKLIQRTRRVLPEWFPLAAPELGKTNVVPVDYVAGAMDHIAHQPGLDGQAFHLMSPRPQHGGQIYNTFARAAHAPQLVMRVDRRLLSMLPKGTISMALRLPAMRGVRRQALADVGIPEQVLSEMDFSPTFDTRDTERALEGTGIAVPPLEDYAWRLWDYYERVLDPDLYKDRSLRGAVNGRTVMITGASSGIGRAAALKVANAGGVPLLVARSADKLEEAKAEIDAAGGTAYTYQCDLSDLDAIDDLVQRVYADHPAVDMLVNNAGRSIRRSLAHSYDRFHDYQRTMQLNYFGTIRLIMGLMPHMRERRSGHIVNVSSIGVQVGPPRFSAYIASKSALDAFTRSVGSEVVGDGVTFTTIHMPLVKTPMIAPTKIYDSFPTSTPDEAAGMICEALRSKPKHIGTRLGTFGQVSGALAPKVVDQILHMAYRLFPESARSAGRKEPAGEVPEEASTEAVAFAHLMRGVHW